MVPDLTSRYQDAFSPLFGRDACSDAFGSNASDSICSPSITLCCVRRGQVFPSCQQYLGKGWCCTGSNATDNCYVDQASECDGQDSVPCTNLADGTTQACCPRLTSCDSSQKAQTNLVRCVMQYGDLKLAGQATSVSLAPSTTAPVSSATPGTSSNSGVATSSRSLTSLPASSATTSVGGLAASVPSASSSTSSSSSPSSLSPSPSPQPLPAALIGGAAVGATLGVVSLVLLSYLFFRRQSKKRRQLQQQKQQEVTYAHPPPTYDHQHTHPIAGVSQHGYGYPAYRGMTTDAGHGYQAHPWYPPVEMMQKDVVAQLEPVELGSGR